jgi:hypothetical protein
MPRPRWADENDVDDDVRWRKAIAMREEVIVFENFMKPDSQLSWIVDLTSYDAVCFTSEILLLLLLRTSRLRCGGTV